jgi:hypothetical protein
MAQIEQAASQTQQYNGTSSGLEEEIDDIARPRWAAIGHGARSELSDTEGSDEDVKPSRYL